MTPNRSVLGLLAVLAAGLPACGNRTLPPTSDRSSPAATSAGSTSGYVLVAVDPSFPGDAATEGAVAGSATVVSGPFQLYGALYRDPSLMAGGRAPDPAHTTDLPGYGFRALWEYRGAGLEDTGRQCQGEVGNLRCLSSNRGFEIGARGGRQGGGFLFSGGPSGDATDELVIELPGGSFGVDVTVHLSADGTAPRSISVRAVR